jgi:hypothetical protein
VIGQLRTACFVVAIIACFVGAAWLVVIAGGLMLDLLVLELGLSRRRARGMRREDDTVASALQRAVDAVLAAPDDATATARACELCRALETSNDDLAALVDVQATAAEDAVGERHWQELLRRAADGGHVERLRAAAQASHPARLIGEERRSRLRAVAPDAAAALERMATRCHDDGARIAVVRAALALARRRRDCRPWTPRSYSALVPLLGELERAARVESGARAREAVALSA